MNSIPADAASAVEYKVHGNFGSRTDGRNFPDTFFFSARELKDAGLPKARIRAAVLQHHAAMLERGMGDLEEVSSDEEELEEGEPAAAMESTAAVESGTDMESVGAAAVEMATPVASAVVENADALYRSSSCPENVQM